ncbi:glycerophosphodiester phosphodiesterase family protein [Luteitalea sp.]|uniref:glycerophosphodiester phosphodiesterase family protein n=1 Tax=Luteitalea sp. TaxID=2004800 RepID=UPI003459A245
MHSAALARAAGADQALARTLRGSGATIHVWTVNDAAQAHALWRAGVQGIIGDDPAAMLAAREAA